MLAQRDEQIQSSIAKARVNVSHFIINIHCCVFSSDAGPGAAGAGVQEERGCIANVPTIGTLNHRRPFVALIGPTATVTATASESAVKTARAESEGNIKELASVREDKRSCNKREQC